MKKKLFFYLLILINNNLNSQSKLSGTYCLDYILKDFSSCYSFNNGFFKYEHSGHIGVSDYGKGIYLIRNDSLILNFNLTKSKNISKVKILSKKDNFKDSIQVKIIVKNHQEVLSYPFNGYVRYKDDSYKNLDINGVVSFKNKRQDSILVSYRNLGFDPIEIKLELRKNYILEISLNDFSGTPILNRKEYYKIEDFLKNKLKQ